MTILWGDEFLTGIREVDCQHRTLVNLVNELERAIAANHGDGMIEDAFRSLAAYTRVHFTLEEQLMDDAGVSVDHVTRHRRAHADFVIDLTRMWHDEDGLGNVPTRLLEFITEWIHQHILITDRAMARGYFKEMRLPMPLQLA